MLRKFVVENHANLKNIGSLVKEASDILPRHSGIYKARLSKSDSGPYPCKLCGVGKSRSNVIFNLCKVLEAPQED